MVGDAPAVDGAERAPLLSTPANVRLPYLSPLGPARSLRRQGCANVCLELRSEDGLLLHSAACSHGRRVH